MTAKLKGTRKDEPAAPEVMDRPRFQVELDALRVREKAHTPTTSCGRPATRHRSNARGAPG
jgi:hypothetical protein